MIVDQDIVEELLLHDEDFPDNYRYMAHPDDYKETATFDPQFIYHSHIGKHNRLIARIAWKVPTTNERSLQEKLDSRTPENYKMIPMSFVCDTGAPSHFYLSKKALQVLQEYGIIKEDDRETQYVRVHVNKNVTFNANVEETPYIHENPDRWL